MAETAERRSDPQALWPEVRSILLLGVNYGPETDPLATSTGGTGARSRSMPATATITT